MFQEAREKLEKNDIQNFEDAIIFIINQVLLSLEDNPAILKFIERNLSWGIFHEQLQTTMDNKEIGMLQQFTLLAKKSGYTFKRPDIILFIIIETVGSTCYNSILYQKPLPFQEYKPYLFEVIRAILKNYKD